jgi:thiosulfate reductase cytochrome b subunit
MAETQPTGRPTWLAYLACYALYALLIAGGIAILFLVVRPAVLALISALLGSSQANRIVYLASITLLGLGLFILVMAAEPYLRNGVERRQLLRRFIRIAAPVVIVGALGLLVLAIV